MQLLELSPRQSGRQVSLSRKNKDRREPWWSCGRSVGLESRPVLTCLYPPFPSFFSTLFLLPIYLMSLRLPLSFFLSLSVHLHGPMSAFTQPNCRNQQKMLPKLPKLVGLASSLTPLSSERNLPKIISIDAIPIP